MKGNLNAKYRILFNIQYKTMFKIKKAILSKNGCYLINSHDTTEVKKRKD